MHIDLTELIGKLLPFIPFILLILLLKHNGKLENTKKFKNASPEEQQVMIEERDRLQKEKKGSSYKYDHDDSNSHIHSSSSSSPTTSYTNPSTGLPMTGSGTGGVDAGGNPYGM